MHSAMSVDGGTRPARGPPDLSEEGIGAACTAHYAPPVRRAPFVLIWTTPPSSPGCVFGRASHGVPARSRSLRLAATSASPWLRPLCLGPSPVAGSTSGRTTSPPWQTDGDGICRRTRRLRRTPCGRCPHASSRAANGGRPGEHGARRCSVGARMFDYKPLLAGTDTDFGVKSSPGSDQ